MAQEGEEKKAPAGIQNSLLRSYFRQQYMTLHNGLQRDENPFFVDQFIDRRIEVFLEEIDRRLTSVRELEAEIEDLRAEQTAATAVPLKRALRRLGDELGDLRKTLSPIFLELKDKNRFRPEIDRTAQETPYAKEFEFIHRRVDAAEQRIRDYLFSSGSTVSVGALKGGDMLVALYEGAQMAKSLSKEY